MKSAAKTLIAIVVLTAGIWGAWFCRGIFDETFMLEGVFHVANASGRDLHVELTFPSGESVEFQLPGGGSHTFVMRDTGEGSLGIRIDDDPVQLTGYLTSLNDPCVIALGDSSFSFSQLFPGSIGR